MAVPYHAYTFTIEPLEPAREILIAELAERGFESFEETETGLEAYIPEGEERGLLLEDIDLLQRPEFTIRYSHRRIAPENWNAQWEKDFKKVYVGDHCVVRAPFHTPEDKAYELIISPKMSFGTGHHETTALMLSYLLETDCTALNVLDMGSGTGVLAILAAKKGAAQVDAIDIDPWCYENCQENTLLNDITNVTAYQGAAADIPGLYPLILANINRNILLQDLPAYARAIQPQGTLLLSGFYRQDLPIIQEAALQNGFDFDSFKENNQWVAAKFLYKR